MNSNWVAMHIPVPDVVEDQDRIVRDFKRIFELLNLEYRYEGIFAKALTPYKITMVATFLVLEPHIKTSINP